MLTNLTELELSCIDRLNREELLNAVRARAGDLPGDLLVDLDELPTDRLQLVLLAGRLIQVLRHLRSLR
jgi:hypothetical protein